MPKRVKVYGCEKCGGYVNGLGICKKCGHHHRPKVVHEPQPDPVPALPSPADVLGQPSLEAILGGVDPGAFAEPAPGQPEEAGQMKTTTVKSLAGSDAASWDVAMASVIEEYQAEMRALAGHHQGSRPPGWGQLLRSCGRA